MDSDGKAKSLASTKHPGSYGLTCRTESTQFGCSETRSLKVPTLEARRSDDERSFDVVSCAALK